MSSPRDSVGISDLHPSSEGILVTRSDTGFPVVTPVEDGPPLTGSGSLLGTSPSPRLPPVDDRSRVPLHTTSTLPRDSGGGEWGSLGLRGETGTWGDESPLVPSGRRGPRGWVASPRLETQSPYSPSRSTFGIKTLTKRQVSCVCLDRLGLVVDPTSVGPPSSPLLDTHLHVPLVDVDRDVTHDRVLCDRRQVVRRFEIVRV